MEYQEGDGISHLSRTLGKLMLKWEADENISEFSQKYVISVQNSGSDTRPLVNKLRRTSHSLRTCIVPAFIYCISVSDTVDMSVITTFTGAQLMLTPLQMIE